MREAHSSNTLGTTNYIKKEYREYYDKHEVVKRDCNRSASSIRQYTDQLKIAEPAKVYLINLVKFCKCIYSLSFFIFN